MTAHLIVSILVLGLLCFTLRSLARSMETPLRASWVPLAVAAALALPMSNGFFIPISHYLFESMSGNVLWFGVVDAALWALAGWFLWRCICRRLGAVDLTVLGMVWAIMAFWYGLGVGVSHFENGPTPVVTDAPIYLAHWASVHLLMLGLFLLLAASSAFCRGWLRYTVTGLLFVPYLLCAIDGINILVRWTKRPINRAAANLREPAALTIMAHNSRLPRAASSLQ